MKKIQHPGEDSFSTSTGPKKTKLNILKTGNVIQVTLLGFSMRR